MHLFDRLRAKRPEPGPAPIRLKETSHLVEGTALQEDSWYLMRYRANDAFCDWDSHSGELMMEQAYSPDASELTAEQAAAVLKQRIFLGIGCENLFYMAVEEFKQSRSVISARELTPLEGRFLFRAKADYDRDTFVVFYGFDCPDGENHALFLTYPKAYAGTDDEAALLGVLEEAVQSYEEEKE